MCITTGNLQKWNVMIHFSESYQFHVICVVEYDSNPKHLFESNDAIQNKINNSSLILTFL